MDWRDPSPRLARAIVAHAAARGVVVTVVAKGEPWCVGLFDGARCDVLVSGATDAAWLAMLPDAELPVAGYVVTDLAVEHVDTAGARLSVLVLRRD